MGEGDRGDRNASTAFHLDEVVPTRRIERDAPPPARFSRRGPGDDGSRRWRRGPLTWDQDRLALIAFIALELVSFVLLYFWLGDQQWFRMSDDWGFLTARRATTLDGLFAPHYGHWVTLPVLVYRSLFTVFGFDYRPYLATIIVAHLVVVALLRVVMRRSGTRPWLATIVASVLLLFGTGRDNIVWSFQISFVGALAFGLVQLVLADHDGPVSRRDAGALLAGALALQCSGVGVVMVAIVGLAALVRRGWRAAILQTVPLAALYAAWYLPNRQQISDQTDLVADGPYGPRQAAAFVWNGLSGTFRGLGGASIVAILLAALLIGGLVLAWLPMTGAERRRRAAMPAALLVGAILFLGATGRQRALYGPLHAYESRYLYMVAAFVLPALAVAVDAVVERWRWAAVPALFLLLVGVPYNVGRFTPPYPENVWSVQAIQLRDLMSVASHFPGADQVPPEVVPAPQLAPSMTIGWLLEQRAAGRIPAPTGDTSALEAEMPIRLGLTYPTDDAAMTATPPCRDVDGDVDMHPKVGDVIVSDGPLTFTLLDDDGNRISRPVKFPLVTRLEVVLPDLHLRVSRGREQPAFRLCTSSPD